MEEMINLITNVGFPVAVTAYLLIRTDSRLRELNDSINRLAVIMEKKEV